MLIYFVPFPHILISSCPITQVAQLVGYISEHAAYHHGEQSLTMTIVNLAQDYVGSNNLNLLLPNGQYGTRDQGGKDHASARYIFTEPAPITRTIFHPADDPLLNYLTEDNDQIEPEWYLPVLPLLLINGAEGIGTGLSQIPIPFLSGFFGR
jgi:DNA topoisomerase-2